MRPWSRLSHGPEPIAQETFIAENLHLNELAALARAQEFAWGAGERRCRSAAEDARAEGEIKLVDQIRLQERAQDAAATFRVRAADAVFSTQRAHHEWQVDGVPGVEMKLRLASEFAA